MSLALGFRHAKVQQLRKLTRRRSERQAAGLFVIEGAKLLEEALAAGARVESVFIEEGTSAPALQLAAAAGVPIERLERGVIERVSDTVTPQPVIAVVKQLDVPLENVADAPAVVVLADVQDPGNAGTVLRSAEASGIGAVVMCGSSVDLYNPKTVRSSAGSMFHVPVVNGGDLTKTLTTLARFGFQTVGTAMDGGASYDEADLTQRVALVFGNEGNGLSPEVLDTLDQALSIPILGRSESLNVSMAASILCFEAARQRRVMTHAS